MPTKDPDKLRLKYRRRYAKHREQILARRRLNRVNRSPESKAQNKLHKREKRAILKQQVIDSISTHCCMKCGESRLPCLDFHHRDKTEKTENISTMLHNGEDIQVIIKEASKCDILCRNCHAVEHWGLTSVCSSL